MRLAVTRSAPAALCSDALKIRRRFKVADAPPAGVTAVLWRDRCRTGSGKGALCRRQETQHRVLSRLWRVSLEGALTSMLIFV
jgi:hypothetical protein